MSRGRFVKVAVLSPLPQLDRLFDYRVPVSLAETDLVGCRVKVSFGRSKHEKDAFVVSYVDESEITREIAEIASLVSPLPVLKPALYQLLRAVADRQCSTLNDLLKLAIPTRSVRVEKAWLGSNSYAVRSAETASEVEPEVVCMLAEPRITAFFFGEKTIQVSGWMHECLSAITLNLAHDASTVIVVPDFRDRLRLRHALIELGLDEYIADFETTATPSVRYENYLKTFDAKPRIVIGSRNAIFAYPQKCETVIVVDESDESLIEPTSPYFATREVALLRQRIAGNRLIFVGNTISAEVQRLLSVGYATLVKQEFVKPKLAFTTSDERVDATAFQAIRQALRADEPVLIQVASPGTSVAIYCAHCATRANCKLCNGPLVINSRGQLTCKWCAALNLDFSCTECSGKKIRQGRAGSTRTLAELGKSFPGVKLIEARAGEFVEQLPRQKMIVVATPGTEPEVSGGYGAVILLDGNVLLNSDSLRARERAIRKWANAISLGAAQCHSVLVGVSSELGQKLSLWQIEQLAQQELAERRELGFPPAMRMASVTGSRAHCVLLLQGIEDEISKLATAANITHARIELLGPVKLEESDAYRTLIKFDYAIGAILAEALRSRNLKLSTSFKAQVSSSGKPVRAVRIKMDEPEVG